MIQTGAQIDCPKATVFLCLDNDRAGNMACKRMAEEFGKADIQYSCVVFLVLREKSPPLG